MTERTLTGRELAKRQKAAQPTTCQAKASQKSAALAFPSAVRQERVDDGTLIYPVRSPSRSPVAHMEAPIKCRVNVGVAWPDQRQIHLDLSSGLAVWTGFV